MANSDVDGGAPSDLSPGGRRVSERSLIDVEWTRLEPLIPEAAPDGRPRKTDMWAAMNAILYLLPAGYP